MHRLPFVRPRFAPRKGQKYQLKHLQPVARQLFERVSSLTNIPVERLLPYRVVDLNKVDANEFKGTPVYLSKFHAVHRPTIFGIFPYPLARHLPEIFYALANGLRNSPSQHEHIHSLMGLLSREKNSSEDAKAIQEGFAELGLAGIRMFHGYPNEDLARSAVGRFYSKYGNDGLLGLMVYYPLLSKPESIDVAGKSLVSRGLLNESGFTPKGCSWFSRIAKKRISRKLSRVLKHRNDYGLPV